MAKFLVTHEAVVTREVPTMEKQQTVPGINLIFYSMVDAENKEQAYEQLTQYSDPNFKSKVMKVDELGEGLTTEELFSLLEHKKVLFEQGP